MREPRLLSARLVLLVGSLIATSTVVRGAEQEPADGTTPDLCGPDALFASIRFVPIATRVGGLEAQEGDSVDACASRLVLYSSGGAGGSTDEEVLALNVSQFGATAELQPPSRITSYKWATASASAGHGCDPVRWRVEGSATGRDWELLDDRSGSPVCVGLQREVLQGPFATACSPLAVQRARFVRIANEGPEPRRLTIGGVEVLPRQPRQEASGGPRFEVLWPGVFSARTPGGDTDTVTLFSPHPGVVEAYSESGTWTGLRAYNAYLASLSDHSEVGDFDSATQTIHFVTRDTQEAAATWTRSRALAEFNLIAKGRLCEPSAPSLFRENCTACSETAVEVVNGQQMCESRCAADDACSYYVWQPGNGTSTSTCSGYSLCQPTEEDTSEGGAGTVAYRRGKSSWKLVMRQSLQEVGHSSYALNPAYLSQEQWRSVNPENPESRLYSDVEHMEEFRGADGKFRFRLIASCDTESGDQDSETHGNEAIQESCASQGIDDFIWMQTSNPMRHDLSSVGGYEPVDVWRTLFAVETTPVEPTAAEDPPTVTDSVPLDYAANFGGLRASVASSCGEQCDTAPWMMEGLDGDGDVLLTLGQSRPYRQAVDEALSDTVREGLRGPERVVTNLELYAMATDESHVNHLPPQGLWHHLDCQGADVWPCWEDGDPSKNATTGCVYGFRGCPSRLAVATVATEYPTDNDCLSARWQYECLAGESCIGSLAGEWITADEQLAEASVGNDESACADVIAFADSGITCLQLAQQLTISDLDVICGTAADRDTTGSWGTRFPQFSACECLCSAAADPANAQSVDHTFSMTQSGSLAMLYEGTPRLYGVAPCDHAPCSESELLLKTESTTVHISGRTVRRRVPARTGTLSADWTLILWDDGSVSTRVASEMCTRVGPAIDDLVLSGNNYASYALSGSSAGETYGQALHGLDGTSMSTNQAISVHLDSKSSSFYELDLGCAADIETVRLWHGGYDSCCDDKSNVNGVSVSLYSSEGATYTRVGVARQVVKLQAPSGYFVSASFDASFVESTTACPAEANCYTCALNHNGGLHTCLSCLEGYNLVDVDENSVGSCVVKCEDALLPTRSCETEVTCAATSCEVLGWQAVPPVHVHARGFAAQHTKMVDGVSAWHDSDATACIRVPAKLKGGMFFQSSKAGLGRGSELYISSSSASAGTVYVFTTTLESGGWPSGACASVEASSERLQCGVDEISESDCAALGCCFIQSECFHKPSLVRDGWAAEGPGPYLSTDARVEDVSPLGWRRCDEGCEEGCVAEDWRLLDNLQGRQLFSECREGMCWHGYEDLDRCEGRPENYDLGHNLVCTEGRHVMRRCMRSQYGETQMWSFEFDRGEIVRLPKTVTPLTLAGVVIQLDNKTAGSVSHCISPEEISRSGVTFEQAEAACRAKGARLCQASELTQNPADFLAARPEMLVWTSSLTALATCPRGYTVCERCCDMDFDCACDDECGPGGENGTDLALPCVLPRPHLQPVQCPPSMRIAMEVSEMGASVPVCVEKSSRVFADSAVDIGFQCCAETSEASCKQSCEVSCEATTSSKTMPTEAGVGPVAMSIEGLVSEAELLEAIGTALVWPCDPYETIDAINASNETSFQHNLDLSLVLDGSTEEYPVGGPEFTCGAALVRGDVLEGAACDSGSDCQSGNCHEDVCGPESAAGDSEYGAACESDSECASASCIDSTARELRVSVASALRSAIDVDCLYTVELKETAAANAADRVSLSLRVLLRRSNANYAVQFSQNELDEIERQVFTGAVGSAIEQVVRRNATVAGAIVRRTEVVYVGIGLNNKRQFIFSAAMGQRLNSLEGFHSCSDIPPGYSSGVYTIVPACGADPQQLYCDLDTDGGGWNLVASSWQHAVEFNSIGAYYDDLQTIIPESGHSGVWDGLLQRHPSGGDLRVSCSSNAHSGNTTFDIDATARDVDWYHEIVAHGPRYGSVAAPTVTNIASCMAAFEGQPSLTGHAFAESVSGEAVCQSMGLTYANGVLREGQSDLQYLWYPMSRDDLCGTTIGVAHDWGDSRSTVVEIRDRDGLCLVRWEPNQNAPFVDHIECDCSDTTMTSLEGATLYIDAHTLESDIVDCSRDKWPDTSRPVACGSLDGMLDDVHEEDGKTMLWGMGVAVALDTFHVSFQACTSLMSSNEGGQMMLWYRNRPTAATPVMTLSATNDSLVGHGWNVSDVIEPPTSVSIGYIQQRPGVRIEKISLPLLPTGFDWTVAWSMTIPNGLSVEENDAAVPLSLRVLLSDMAPGWHRALMTWGKSQPLRFSVDGRSWQYYGVESANSVAQTIFEAQRNSAQDSLVTDLQIFAAVLRLGSTELVQLDPLVIGHDIMVASEESQPRNGHTLLDRSLAFERPGWVTAWSACVAENTTQSTLNAQVWRPPVPNDASGRLNCVEVGEGQVVPVAGTLYPNEMTGDGIDLPPGGVLPIAGTFCLSAGLTGCHPRELPPCESMFEESDCSYIHCEWRDGSCQDNTDLAACHTYESYSDCPHERCQFIGEYTLVCTYEFSMPREQFDTAAEDTTMCPLGGRWYRLEVPYNKQCEVMAGDIIGWNSQTPSGLIGSGRAQHSDRQDTGWVSPTTPVDHSALGWSTLIASAVDESVATHSAFPGQSGYIIFDVGVGTRIHRMRYRNDGDAADARLIDLESADTQNGPWSPLVSLEASMSSDWQESSDFDSVARFVKFSWSNNHGHEAGTRVVDIQFRTARLDTASMTQSSGPNLFVSTSPTESLTEGSVQQFASAEPSGNLAYALTAAVRSASEFRVAPLFETHAWSGAAEVYQYGVDDSSMCEGLDSQSGTLTHVERLSEASVCETYEIAQGVYYYQKRSCTAVGGLQAWQHCSDDRCAICADTVNMVVAAVGRAAEASTSTCYLHSSCAKYRLPGQVLGMHPRLSAAARVYPQCFNQHADVQIVEQALQQCSLGDSDATPHPSPSPPPAPQPSVGLRDCDAYSQTFCDARCQACHKYGQVEDCEGTGRCVWQVEAEESGTMTAEMTLADDASDMIETGWEIVLSIPDPGGGDATAVRGIVRNYNATTKVVEATWEAHEAAPPDTSAGTEYTMRRSAVCGDLAEDLIVDAPDCTHHCVGFKHCLTCQPVIGGDPRMCPGALPNLCAETECSDVLDDADLPYVLCDGACVPQDVCATAGDRPSGTTCSSDGQCVSSACAEHPDECPRGCISFPFSYCASNSLDATQCASMAQLMQVCPAEFSACENAKARCRPTPCEPVSCLTELAAFHSRLNNDDSSRYDAYDPFGNSVFYWQAHVESIYACARDNDRQQGGR